MKPKLPSTSFRPPPRFQWPEGYRSALMLCFDIDGETTALSEDAAYEQRLTTMSQCTYGPCVGVPRILGLLEHYQINATFFVPTYVVEAHPRMTQIVHESGHELGVHGHLHERLIHLSEPEEAQILQKSL
ncbi:MAG: polysaccharide deacetylase family protein, partial [Verrucomicrobiota bacterium]